MDLYKGKRNDCWRTPHTLFSKILECWPVKYDMAADAANAKTPYFSTEAQDSLSFEWPGDGICFLNPPFSKAKKFAEKVVLEALRGKQIVVLYKSANQDATAWQDFLLKHSDWVHVIRGRTNYLNEQDVPVVGVPFGSALVGFNVPPPNSHLIPGTTMVRFKESK